MEKKVQMRGHCQGCGRLQAANPRMAKHGYTVTCGYFNGVCFGAGHLPLEQERSLLDAMRVTAAADAGRMEDRALKIDQREDLPETYKDRVREGWLNGAPNYVVKEYRYDALNDYERKLKYDRLAWSLRQDAKQLRQWNEDMGRLADRVHGQPLVEVPAPTKAARIAAGEKRMGGGKVLTARYQDGARVYWRSDSGKGWMGAQAWRKLEVVA